MKLYMLLYIAGHLSGTVGPLPYDMAECETRAADILSHGNPEVRIEPEGYTLKDVRMECKFYERRPDLPLDKLN